MLSLTGWAQNVDDLDPDDALGMRRGASRMDGMDDMMTTPSIHITTTHLIVLAALILACYVFGKIWKGCIYLIIVIAVAFWFLLNS